MVVCLAMCLWLCVTSRRSSGTSCFWRRSFLWLGSRQDGSFDLWLSVWVTGKTMWSLVSCLSTLVMSLIKNQVLYLLTYCMWLICRAVTRPSLTGCTNTCRSFSFSSHLTCFRCVYQCMTPLFHSARNAWQSLAYSLPGIAVSPPSE